MKKKFVGFLTLSTFIAIICCTLLLAIPKKTNVAATTSMESEYLVNNGIYDDEYTGTDSPHGINIDEYIQKYYATNASLSGTGVFDGIHVYDDDPIINIIPEHLFKEAGTTFYIGQEYGFIIETFKPARIQGLHSRVAVFDIEKNENLYETRDHYTITVKKLFEAEYAYISIDTQYMLVQNRQTYGPYFQDGYTQDLTKVHSDNAAHSTMIVPVPRAKVITAEFRETNTFYFTDFASQLSLYNVNHLNPIDAKLYDPYQDMGAYFTQMDFEYTGNFFQEGGENPSGTGTVAMNAASLSWDIASELTHNPIVSAIKACPVIGIGLGFTDLIGSFVELEQSLADKLVSAEKKLTYTPYHTYRESQLEQNGFLNKDIQYAVDDTGSQKLYIGTGDSVTMDFQITGTEVNWETQLANILFMDAIKIKGVPDVTPGVIECRLGDEIEGKSGTYTDKLILLKNDTVEAPQIGRTDENFINFLPAAKPKRSFTADFNGPYTFCAQNDGNVSFNIYSSDSFSPESLVAQSQYTDGKSTVSDLYLPRGTYYLAFTESTNRAVLQVPFTVEFIPPNISLGQTEVTFDDSDSEYMRFKAEEFTNYRIRLGDINASMCFMDDNFEVKDGSTGHEFYGILISGEDVCIKISFDTAVTKNITIDISREKHVNFDSSGGSSVDSITIVDDSAVFDLPRPVRIGYEFLGWTLETGDTVLTQSEIAAIRNTTSINLRAKWAIKTYSIFYNENGGDELFDGSYTVSQAVTLDAGALRAGYTFLGWYDNVALSGNAVTGFLSGETGDKTYFADWVLTNQLILLDVSKEFTDGESAQIDAAVANVVYGQDFTLPVPHIKGFVFEGWYQGDIKYTANDGKSLHRYEERQNLSLSAKWAREVYYIKIEVDGAFRWLSNDGLTAQESFVSYQSGLCPDCWMKLQVPLAHYYKDGHILQGLVTDKNNPQSFACWTGLATLPLSGQTVELYANYTKEQNFKIVFYEYSELVLPSLEGEYGIRVSLPIAQKTGHTFVKWVVADYDKNDIFANTQLQKGREFSYASMPDLSVGYQSGGISIYLKAVFETNEYTITLVDGAWRGTAKVVFGQGLSGVAVRAKAGYVFMGWADASGKIIINQSGVLTEPWNIASDKSLNASWTPHLYTVALNPEGGYCEQKSVVAIFGSPMPRVPAPIRRGYDFTGYFTGANGTGIKYYDANMTSARNWDIAEPSALYACWTAIRYTITFVYGGAGFVSNPTTYTIETPTFTLAPPTGSPKIGYQYAWEIPQIKKGFYGNLTISTVPIPITYIAFWNRGQNIGLGTSAYSGDILTYNQSYKYLAYDPAEGYEFVHWEANRTRHHGVSVNETWVIGNTQEIAIRNLSDYQDDFVRVNPVYQETKQCVATGTLITLADGSQVPVEQLTGNEMLLVWNLKTGCFDVAPILFIDSDAAREYQVINLYFSDGTQVKVISEHGFWDFDLNQYVFLREDAAQYIGHWFKKQITDADGKLSWTRLQLVDVLVQTEYTIAWSPVTYEYLCYYVNGMLSMPGATDGLINIFEVNGETMQYDQEAFEADIAEYGLFTYEEFAAICSLPEIMFEALGGQYLKVSIGKGLITWDVIQSLAERYGNFFK